MFEELKKIMGGLDHYQKIGAQRAGILATIVASLNGADKFDTVNEFKEFIALKLLMMMQECPVGDFIDGKVVITVTEMVPDAVESMSPETRASFEKLKALIDDKQDEMIMDDMIDDLDIPIEK